MTEVHDAIEHIIHDHTPDKVGSDSGKEFLNSKIKALFNSYGVIHFLAQEGLL